MFFGGVVRFSMLLHPVFEESAKRGAGRKSRLRRRRRRDGGGICEDSGLLLLLGGVFGSLTGERRLGRAERVSVLGTAGTVANPTPRVYVAPGFSVAVLILSDAE